MLQPKIWLVTGVSSGLGTSIALSALRAGHKVVATARNVEKAQRDNPDIEALGGEWLKLDVTKTDTQRIVEETIQRLGRIDVVVNNAGYLKMGTLEDVSVEDVQDIMNTNFFGMVRVLKAVIPTMRQQRYGTVVNVSSMFGLYGPNGSFSYASTKFAMEGLTESVSKDLAEFGIRFVLLEPGVFRTKVIDNARFNSGDVSEAYRTQDVWGQVESAQANLELLQGDPDKLGDKTVAFVDGSGEFATLQSYPRLMLGKDCIQVAQMKLDALKENVAAMQEIAASTDFDDAPEVDRKF